jgi:biopolymer transport protein TolR
MPKVQPAASAPGGRVRGRRTVSSLAEINVVPLVDVMLVLLIIFMVTAPMIQRGVDVSLPVAARAAQVEGDRVFVTIPAAFREDRTVYLGEERIRIDALRERVRQRMETLSDKEVFLSGDATVQLQELIEVMDRLNEAGVSKVGVLAKAPGDR